MQGPSILPLALENISLQHEGLPILDRINMLVARQRTTVVLGPNGAGKSMVLKVAHGLISPDAGHVRWSNLSGAKAQTRQAMVFQKPVLLNRSVLSNIVHAVRLQGIDKAAAVHRAHMALERVGLGDLAGRRARSLSGGEQQRLTFARAWARDPEVLFLDEPTASLDPAAGWGIEEIIVELRREGRTVILSAHDRAMARRLADDLVFLHRGRALEAGAAATLLTAPRTAELEAFLKGELRW
ncbi:MAG: ATP-binding cassette domain-containing protein [Rhodospirillaceae bacterium]|nr:ATP-binding cassette domain-containing protein [Rhodospirillaceae bacterium]